jgi:serine/threonine protein kinase/Flp pilus assembly protein TadD
VTPERWEQVKNVFHEALELEPERRSSYLDGACAKHPFLRQEIESLLRNHEEAGDLMESPAHVTSGLDGDSPADAWVGRHIGPYLTIAKIGEGGMGAVYRAVRVDDHYLKQVAIKIVRGGFVTGQHLRRFKNERQIMASLEHQNIARLLDGGATEEGLPYLVMEYIEGQEIDAYCDSKRLNTVERLKLFRQVCTAVQYAHQNLVIHRDLKPGNILVTDGGTPKLLDFGIAKLLDPELFFQTVDPAGTMMKAMTPEYASPEQVRGDPVSTSSDVYSLGVILYRLLTGHPPYHVDTSAPFEMVRAISEVEPERPSEVISRKSEITNSTGQRVQLTPESVSESREGRPAVLRRRLAGDLDNIVLKALRKEPARRYASAEQFSADIGRYLDGLPIEARADTLTYRTGKFVRRHKAPVAAAILVFATLVGGIIMTMREARIAEQQRARAERRFNDVRKLARDLMLDIHDSIQYLPGATPARKLIVQDALAYLDSLAKESADDVSLQRELATAYEKVGDVQGLDSRSNLGDTAGALTSFRKSLAIRKGILAGDPNDSQSQSDLAEAYDKLGGILAQMGHQDEALQNMQQALEIRKQLASGAPNDAIAQLNLATIYDSIANVYADQKELDLSLVSTRTSLGIFDKLLAQDPQNERYRRDCSLEHKKVGGILEAQGKYAAALEEYQTSLAVDEQLATANPQDALAQRDLSITYSSIGDILLETGDTAKALKQYRQAAAIDEAIATADPKDAWAQRYVVYDTKRVGDALLKIGDMSAADAAYEKAMSRAEARAKADPTNAGAQTDLAEIYSRLGRLHYSRATSLEKSVAGKRARLLAARAWYEKSRNLWDAMQHEGTLNAINAPDSQAVVAELEKCEAALNRLRR